MAAIFPILSACDTNADTCLDSELVPSISVNFSIQVFVNDIEGAPSNIGLAEIRVHKETCEGDSKGYFGWNPVTAFGYAQNGPFGYNLNNDDDRVIATVTVTEGGKTSTKTQIIAPRDVSNGQTKVITLNFL